MKNTSAESPDNPKIAARKPKTPQGFWGFILGGVVIVAIALIGWLLTNRPGDSSGSTAAGPLRAGMRMPDFTLQDTSGRTLHLSDYQGQTVLINTWATWCPPCQAEMPALNALLGQYRDRKFVILSINAGEQTTLVADFARANNLQFPVLLDPGERWMNQSGIHDYPTSILVGKDGVIKTIHVGILTPDIIQRQIQPLIE
jgi:peroxiredoxin